MGFVRSNSSSGSGSGSGQNLAWETDQFTITSNISSGHTFSLTETPVDEDSVNAVLSGIGGLDPDSFSVSGNTVTIHFDLTASADDPYTFQFKYPYDQNA